MDAARLLIREPDVADAGHYRRRTGRLAGIYLVLFSASVAGLALLLWRGRLFVTLSQRSNVETLTIAFFILFFSYVALLTTRGALGGLRVALYRARAAIGRDSAAVERRKIAALGPRGPGPSVALNQVLEREDSPAKPFEIRVADAAGEVGRLRIDGVVVEHAAAHRAGSNDMLAFFVRQVVAVLGANPDVLEIVEWKSLGDESWHKYVASVQSMRLLGARLGNGMALWPRLTLTPAQCAEIERRMSAICPVVREEAFLPPLEFEGEHKVPIIPEPLGVLSLKRTQRRVDPLSSMGAAAAVVLAVVALLIWFIVRPPWVPGT